MNITKRLSTTGALLLVFVFFSQVLFPIQADAAGSKSYAAKEQIQTVDGYNICHLRDEGWCGATQFDGDNVNFEAGAGLEVHCNKTSVDYRMYSHSTKVDDGTVTIQRAAYSANLGAIKVDETKNFDIKTIANQMGITNTAGIYTLSLKFDEYKNPVSILLYYNGSKVQTCWKTTYAQYDIDVWEKIVGKLDPNTCLDMYVGNKNNPITYPTS